MPDGTIITWRIDEDGHPSHDQGAKLAQVSLLDCEALLVHEDGRIQTMTSSSYGDPFQRAVVLYDRRLWISDADWDFS